MKRLLLAAAVIGLPYVWHGEVIAGGTDLLPHAVKNYSTPVGPFPSYPSPWYGPCF